MKNNLLFLLLMAFSSLFLVNCAKKSGGSSAATVVPAGAGVCQAGQVYTQYGCLPQTSSCPANHGFTNGSCYPAVANTGILPTTTCSSTDVVNTQYGQLTVGVCQPYCAQYGRKYGYYNGNCYLGQ